MVVKHLCCTLPVMVKISEAQKGKNNEMEKDLVKMKPEKTWEFRLPVTTKPNKQRQGLNLYGSFIQMAGDLRRWRVHTLTDYLVFSFQANVFIAGDKQDVVRGFENQGKVNWIRKKTTSVFLYWAVVLSCAPGSGL